MIQHICNCLKLFRHFVVCALSLARFKAGNSMAARMAMMAMTTSNSMRVKPPGRLWPALNVFEEFMNMPLRYDLD